MKKKVAAFIMIVLGICAASYFGDTFAWFSDREYVDSGEGVNLGFVDIDIETEVVKPMIVWPGENHKDDDMSAFIFYKLSNLSEQPVVGRMSVKPANIYILPEKALDDLYDEHSQLIVPKDTQLRSATKEPIANGYSDYLLTPEGVLYGQMVIEDYLNYLDALEQKQQNPDEPIYRTFYEKVGYSSELYDQIILQDYSIDLSDAEGVLTNGDDKLDVFADDLTNGFVFEYGMLDKNPSDDAATHFTLELRMGLDGEAGNIFAYSIIEPAGGVSATATQAKSEAFESFYDGDTLDPDFEEELIHMGIMR